jgi:hypothetical protein
MFKLAQAVFLTKIGVEDSLRHLAVIYAEWSGLQDSLSSVLL